MTSRWPVNCIISPLTFLIPLFTRYLRLFFCVFLFRQPIGLGQLVFHTRLHHKHQDLEFLDAWIWACRRQNDSHGKHWIDCDEGEGEVSTAIFPRVQVESKGLSTHPMDTWRHHIRLNQHSLVPWCQQFGGMRTIPFGVLQESPTGASPHPRALSQRPEEHFGSVLHFWWFQFSLWYRRCSQGDSIAALSLE